MAVLDKVKNAIADHSVPGDVNERLKRGRSRMKEQRGKRNECMSFWRGDQYNWVDSRGALQSQATTSNYEGSGKPRHRARTTRNLIFDVVEHETASAVQRIPDYEISPSTTDPEDVDAARLSSKVARYGYDKWHVRDVSERVVRTAIIAEEGFAWPYFDTSVGPYIGDGIGQGEVKIRTFGGNECFWEPGVPFMESRWHAIEQARDPKDVVEYEGYVGGNLKSDAETTTDSKLVMVTEYLERPCAKYQNGRWITVANGKVIIPERPYPLTTPDGETIDEPVIHKLAYATDPEKDRDVGLVRHLLDAQRTYNDSVNKQILWKNLAMNPQVVIQNGEFKQRLTDEPGAVFHAVGTGEISWRPVPEMPQALTELKNEAKSDIAQISAQNDIPQNVNTASGISALIERDQNRRNNFIANLAQFHSRLMRHCLFLVQKHYTEKRLLKVRGRFGPELIEGFLGAQLRGQADVTVMPGSIEPRTKSQITQQIIAFADRGWVSPQAAMAAINGGTAEGLVRSYELDLERANLVIQQIKEGPEVLFGQPPRPVLPGEDAGPELDENGRPIPQLDPNGQPVVDPMTGEPAYVPATSIEGWMPRPFDNIEVQLSQFEDWMKTVDYSNSPAPVQEAANVYYAALKDLQMKKQAEAQAAQVETAQGLGMANATRPTSAGMPDQAGGTKQGGSGFGQVFGPRYQAGNTTTF